VTVLVLGSPADARGFRLAGATTVTCATRGDVQRATTGARTDGCALVLVSPEVYGIAPREIDALGRRRRGPLVLVLPGTSREEAA
jgi:vacuolar-type H+-ATPase subunit F/Vma7